MGNLFFISLAAVLAFLPFCRGFCCSNLNILCVGQPTCESSNCADGVSFCYPDQEVCLNDGFGGCEPIVWVTIYIFPVLFTATEYTATTQEYSTSVYWDYTTVEDDVDASTTLTEDDTSTTTVTEPGPTVTTTIEARRKALKRDVTQTTTVSDDNYCNSVSDPDCTTTIQEVWTDFGTVTDTSVSTIFATNINPVTVYVTSWHVETYTYTADAVTVSVAAGDNDPQSTSEPASSSSPEEESSAQSQSADPTPGQSTLVDAASLTEGPGRPGSPSSTFATVIVPTTPLGSSGDTSALAVLQTAVPITAQRNAEGACFLFTQYSAAYTTPAWYTGLATNVQSYFGSLNANNTAACSPSPTPTSAGHSAGLSPGAKGGIAVGAIAGAALLGALAFWALSKFAPFKPSMKNAPQQARPAPNENGGEPLQRNFTGPMQMAPNASWPGGHPTVIPAQTAVHHPQQPMTDTHSFQPGQNYNTGSDMTHPSQPMSNGGEMSQPSQPFNSGSEMNQLPQNPNAGSGMTPNAQPPSTGSPPGWSGVVGDPASGHLSGVTGGAQMSPASLSPGWSGVAGDPTSIAHSGLAAPPSAPPGSDPDFFLLAGAARRRRNSRDNIHQPPPPHAFDKPERPSMYSSPATSHYSIPRRAVPTGGSSSFSHDPFADPRTGASSPMTELGVGGAAYRQGHEVDGRQRYEAPSPGAAHEVHGRERYEVEGWSHGYQS